jgi:predicted amidophosphoribosyltransferase
VSSLLHLLVPPLCAICADACDADEDACAVCLTELAASPGRSFAVPGANAGWAATAYQGAGRRLVTQLKFARRLRLARVAAHAIAEEMPEPPRSAAVVPVPADPLRMRLRGFDPTGVIAGELGTITGLPLSRCLVRSHGRRQVGRSRAERIATEPGVRVAPPVPPAAILVDDVVTTGATLAACGRALETGGCEEVLAVAFARA